MIQSKLLHYIEPSTELTTERPNDDVVYRIRPNSRTVRLGFSKLLGTLICGKICIYLLRIHYKKDQKKDLFDDDYVIVSDFLYKGICCGHSFELHRQDEYPQHMLLKRSKEKLHWL